MHSGKDRSGQRGEQAWRRLRLLVWTAGLVLIPFSNGAGCSPHSSSSPSVTKSTGSGTLLQGQAGSIVLSCVPVEEDHVIQSVSADLSALGGTADQPLANTTGDEWTWSGWVTPPTSGEVNVRLTAEDEGGNSGNATVALTVTVPDPNRLVLDLGNAVVIELVKIRAGSFEMGTGSTDVIPVYHLGETEPVQDSDWSSAARPLHTVTFAQPFYMGKYPVTQAQWIAVMGASDLHAPSGSDFPAAWLSWDDAVGFCQALSARVGRTVRLPAEAEWEYACKAGSGDTKYSFGNDENLLGEYAWYVDNSDRVWHLVGQKLPNAWGLYDMHGSMWEWCQDLWHSSYNSAPADGSVWSTGGDTAARVLRGGSISNTAGACRSAYRNRFEVTDRYGDFGLRIAISSE